MPKKKPQRGKTKHPGRSSPETLSPELYLAAINAVGHAVHVVDRDLKICVFNRSFRDWCRELAIDVDNVIGRDVLEAFPFLDKEVRTEYLQVFETGKVLVTEEQVSIKGRVVLTRTEKSPLRKDGAVTHVVTIVADITDLRAAEEKLRASEQRHRLVVENVPVVIAVVDKDGEFLFINRPGAGSFKSTPEDVIGETHFDLFPADVAERQVGIIRDVIDSEKAFHDTIYIPVGEEWGWFDINVQPYRDSQTRSEAVLVIANDITRYKNAIDALQQSEERFRLLFQSVPLPTYIWQYRDPEFYLIGYNAAAQDITQGKIEDFVGQKASEMYKHMPEVKSDLKRSLRDKKMIRKEIPYKFMSTGEERFLVVYYVFVAPDSVLVYTEDITERNRAREELQRAHDQLEQRVKERTQELAAINEALHVEREAMRQKNIALNEVLDQIEQGKRQLASQIQANINRIALPILKSLEARTDLADRQYIRLLRSNLEEIASPLTGQLEERFKNLTPREMEICHLTRNGLSCKDIAASFNTSVQTVLKQRSVIRKKLGIANKKVNLTSFLKSS